ncbi:MAG: hypothetical protein IPK29_03625 [Betaproteobacteria bacterium]|nr:hypothetical protein [Betaproteobacteria bacterium]
MRKVELYFDEVRSWRGFPGSGVVNSDNFSPVATRSGRVARACAALLCALALGLPAAGAQAQAPAQAPAPAPATQPAAPPRSVDDILALLDQYRPDPAAIARLQAALDISPPAVDAQTADPRERHQLSIHHHRRARAYGQLGRTARQIAELNLALQYVWDGAVPEGFDSLGQRVRILMN